MRTPIMRSLAVCLLFSACTGSSGDEGGGALLGGGGVGAASGDGGSGNGNGEGAAGQGGDGGSISFEADYPMPPGVGTGHDVFVATDGDDGNDGLSLASPKLTIGAAFDAAEPGSIIYVRAGSYGGFVVQDGDFGTESQWILLRPYEEEAVVIRGDDEGPTVYFYADACDEANELVNGDCTRAYVRLEGLALEGSPIGGGDGNVIKIDTPEVQIIKNKLCCSKADVIKNVRTGDDTKIVGNEIWQDAAVLTPSANAQGIDITGADRLLVAGNYLHDLTDIAMYAKGNARETTFESNLVVNSGLGGEGNAIMCGQSTDADRLVDGDYETYDCLVRNNVVHTAAGACVAVGSSQRARVVHNTCFDTAISIHAALFLTNESEINQASTDVELRGNIVYQTNGARAFTDSDELGMTDWSTLVVRDNLYFDTAGSPRFSLKNSAIEDGGDYAAWLVAFADKTGNADVSLVGDPLFVDESSFALGAGSPARDAIDCFSPADRLGTARPQGPRCDVGAWEMPR
ncbi:MAG: right-handed parallel beta-helix repeat-containing protein [Myxococcales bacterium]|nr:right-handed parallel beta-helix repeat-containing protein [Myxococcales bacterium]